jgi:hypothetical protein
VPSAAVVERGLRGGRLWLQVLGTHLEHDPLSAPSALRSMLPPRQDDEQALLLGVMEQRLKGADSVLGEVWGDVRRVLSVPSLFIIIAQVGAQHRTPRGAGLAAIGTFAARRSIAAPTPQPLKGVVQPCLQCQK